MRVRMLWLGVILAAPLVATGQPRAGPGPPLRPNVVFILVDDLRWDELGSTGHPFAKTPNIDRIASDGARFRNAFVTTPLCSPSRASFLTGQYAHTHGITDNTDRSAASHQLVTFPLLLQRAGYETAFVGKWHMGIVLRGQQIDQLALNLDLAPTVLSLAGVPVPGGMQGRSLVPLLKGERPVWRDAFLIEYYSDTVFPRILKMGYKAVRTERWKYVHYLELEGMDEPYDLSVDPYEMKNLIDEPGARSALEAMQAELRRMLSDVPSCTDACLV